MTIPVVADADTLFPATTRGLLIYLDYCGLTKLHWSPLILDEVSRALVDTGRKRTLAQAKAHEERMCDALSNAMVAVEDVQAQFEAVTPAVRSMKDMHVAACAYYLIATDAYPGREAVTLVTRNTKDFRTGALARLGIALRNPDEFLVELFETWPRDFALAFHRFRTDLASRPEPQVLLERLRKDGQVQVTRRLLDASQAQVVQL